MVMNVDPVLAQQHHIHIHQLGHERRREGRHPCVMGRPGRRGRRVRQTELMPTEDALQVSRPDPYRQLSRLFHAVAQRRPPTT